MPDVKDVIADIRADIDIDAAAREMIGDDFQFFGFGERAVEVMNLDQVGSVSYER